ncbi:unnamed protein product [Diplocarpon coronariae]
MLRCAGCTFWPGPQGFEGITDFDSKDLLRLSVTDVAAFTEGGYNPGETSICTGKTKHVGSTYVGEWNFMKSLSPSKKQHEAIYPRRSKLASFALQERQRIFQRDIFLGCRLFCRHCHSISSGVANTVRQWSLQSADR